MLSLNSADLIAVNNRPVFTFEAVAGLDPRQLVGQAVAIDGKIYRVTGVDTYAVIDATGMAFGLSVTRDS